MKNKLNTPLKKALFGLVATAAALAVIWGGLLLVRSVNRQAVNVYEVSNFTTYDYDGSSSQSSGTVTTDKLQKVYISDTQTVKVTYVTEGQTVHKGDKLLSYDSTLSELELTRAEIALERQKLAIEDSEENLELLDKAKTQEELQSELTKLQAKLEAAQAEYRGDTPHVNENCLPKAEEQLGTREKPRYLLYDKKFSLSDLDEGYTVLYTESSDGVPENYLGLCYDGTSLSFFDPPALPTVADAAEGQEDVVAIQKQIDKIEALMVEAYTRKDLSAMIRSENQALTEAKNAYRLAELELASKKKEVGSNIVYSEVTGTVKAVRDATEAYKNNEPVVEVSGGGGYYITGSLSEMALGSVEIGQTVNISSWQTGVSCEGEIVSIENYPTTDTGWSNGNPNVSWYPFRVFVSEDANLLPGDYVDISYQTTQSSSDSWFLENQFIRTDKGRSYVMLRGEDGRLQQQWIQTGRGLWGSYTEILGGLTQEDWVAFPYGKDTVVGAKTREATTDELYNYY